MLGFLFGTACLFGLYKVARHGGRGRWRHGRGWFARRIFQRLETTPGQEKLFITAFEELRAEAEKLRGEGRQFREDVAAAVRGDEYAQGKLHEAFARQDAVIQNVRRSLVASLGKIHEALDARQRRELADLIEGRGDWGRHCGGFRYAA